MSSSDRKRSNTPSIVRRAAAWAAPLLGLSLLAGAGCIGSSTTPCGGQVCPRGFECDDLHQLCIRPQQRTLCADQGLVDGDRCTVEGLDDFHCDQGICIPGRCGDGVHDASEECDDGDANADDIPDACRTNCRLPRCGDGIIDPSNSEACDDGPANSNSTPDGCRINCSPPRCADGVADPAAGEECDDGNFTPGDGCGPTCLFERCGNAFVDAEAGEECDDGGALSNDGCSSCCGVETRRWTVVAGPGPRWNFAMAYDHARGRTILFGGADDLGIARDDTWALFRGGWRPLTPAQAPGARSGHALAYHEARDEIVLFGGAGPSGLQDETWIFDGRGWARLTVPAAPMARIGHAMAYDAARARVVLFGGTDNSGNFADTWEFDGITWSSVSTPNAPSDRTGSALAYDGARARIILFGGVRPGGPLADTWSYDGADWTDITPANAVDSPPVRAYHTLAYDTDRARVVVMGGVNGLAPPYDDTWELAGTVWVDTTPAAAPDNLGARSRAAMVYDRHEGEVVVYGGIATVPLSDVWGWDGAIWRHRAISGQPLPRMEAAATFDASGGAVVLFGGTDGTNELADTWELRDGVWSPVATATAPPPRQSAAMAYDAVRGQVVLFGGYDGSRLGDTWSYRGGVWTQLNPPTSPDARRGHAMVYDSASARLVLFGGDRIGAGDDTWEFDGTTWREITPATSPPARSGHAMAYDASRLQVVLFGGSGDRDDTWEFDGTTWREVTTPTRPLERYGHAMAYDAARHRVVLFGGWADPFTRLGDLWAFDGRDWQPLSPRPVPSPRGHAALVYDPVRGETLLLTGTAIGIGLTNEVWRLGFTSTCPTEICEPGSDTDGDGLAGCADPDCAADPRCAACGDGECARGETCTSCAADCGDCTGCSRPEILIGEVAWGTPDYIELINTSTCPQDGAGLTLLFRFDCDNGPQAFTLPAPSAIAAGGVWRLVEERGSTLPGEVDSAATICFNAGGGGWAMLCDGACDLQTCSNVLDYVELAGSAAPTNPPGCAGFSPAPLDITGGAADESATRGAFNGRGPAGVAGDWTVTTRSRD